MEFLRNRWLTILACLLSICSFGLGYVLYFNYDMSEKAIMGCLGIAVVVSVLLIIIDAVLFNRNAEMDEEERMEIDSLYDQLEQSQNQINSLEESQKRISLNLRNSENIIEQLKREKNVNLEQIEMLNRRVEELTFSSNNPVSDSAKSVSNVESDKELDAYRDIIGQWAVDTIDSVVAVKKFSDSNENKELLKNSEIIYGNLEKILYFTNINKLDGEVEMTECPIGNVVKEVLKKYTYIFNDKKIGIFRKGLESVVVTNKMWLAYGFSQVLYNALYSTGEFGKISVIAKEDDTSVYLTVEDSSMGIHEEEMPNIFDPGFVSSEAKRISGNTTSTCFYLAKKALEKIDGQISVDSKYGMGTKVTMKLKKAEPKD